jgi:predicted RNase H-like HicB family nuclease
MPDALDVEVKKLKDGWFYAKIKNLAGCSTQARDANELYLMVNDAVHTYFDVPKEYTPYVRNYLPPEDLRKKLGIEVQESSFVFKHA